MRSIFPIVEGEGEVGALPILIRRVLKAQSATGRALVRKPTREHRGTLLRSGKLERIARAVLRKAKGDARILLLIDADDDCAATLEPKLQRRLDREFGAGICAAVLAVREYENWLIASAAAFTQDRSFRNNIRPPSNPETVPNAKQWLSERRTDRYSYRPTIHQAQLTERIDVEVVRQQCPSFDKFWREIERLATA